MLQTLRNIEPVSAEMILARLTMSFLPNPFESEYNINDDIHKQVLSEVKKRTHVRENDNSLKAKTKILAFLTNEIANMSLTPEREKKAKERLGVGGVLPIDEYDIKMTPVIDTFQVMGVKPSYITNAIRRSDRFYHIQDPKIPISFFSKKIETDSSDNNFIFLVVASRDKTNLVVRGAWRIYLSDVHVSEDYSPYQLFLAFVERYCLTIRLPGLEWSKFILFDIVTTPNRNIANLVEINDFDKSSQDFLACAVIKTTSIWNVFEAFCIYAVDISKYRHDLRNHGIEFTGHLEYRSTFVTYN